MIIVQEYSLNALPRVIVVYHNFHWCVIKRVIYLIPLPVMRVVLVHPLMKYQGHWFVFLIFVTGSNCINQCDYIKGIV